MAQGKPGQRRDRQSSQGQSTPGPAARVKKPVVDRRLQPPPGTRQSVAAARQTSASSNRTQMIIGAVAVALIAIVVIVGLVLNKKANAAPVTDHPKSLTSTATIAGGVITVTGGPTAGVPQPALTLDVFEDGLCPFCQAFESQFGQQIAKGVDEGKLSVRYHFLNFLNKASASKDYSTRAAAAFECVAQVPTASAPKGLFMNFHTMMFTSGTQPAENGAADLSNAQIAKVAVSAGAPQSAASCITAGTNVAAAQTAADTASALLTKATPAGKEISTPAVVRDGSLQNLNSTSWLTDLLS